MRETKRIKRTTNILAILWEEYYPDWRFGQLINNLQSFTEDDLFYYEEEELIDALIVFISNYHVSDKVNEESLRGLIKEREDV